jgi:hypothetical protein
MSEFFTNEQAIAYFNSPAAQPKNAGEFAEIVTLFNAVNPYECWFLTVIMIHVRLILEFINECEDKERMLGFRNSLQSTLNHSMFSN